MRRESHVRFCVGGGAKLPSATRLSHVSHVLFPPRLSFGALPVSSKTVIRSAPSVDRCNSLARGMSISGAHFTTDPCSQRILAPHAEARPESDW